MIKRNFPSFGINKINNKYVACLIVYDDNPIYHDDEFHEYIEGIMKKIGKVRSYLHMSIIFADRNAFLIDWDSMRFEFELKNQLMFFDDEKLTNTLYIEDLLSEFEKLKNT
jgi:hypothetical protein